MNAAKPDLAHFHNTFPLISPSAYYALRRQHVPIVQTLSNFRLLCPGSMFLRDGKPCEECSGSGWFGPAIRHGCYRNSRAATVAVAGMLLAHRAIGTWQRRIDVYIALSEFARKKFVQGGLPEDRIVVKRNFIAPDPGAGDCDGGYALFVGRLSEEKGVQTLADAWGRLPDVPLMVAGEGPLDSIAWPRNARLLGQQSRARVMELMKSARVLIFPSICYENAPMAILEALACGLPVIASDLGSIPELAQDGRSGLLFRPGDAEDLTRQVRWAWEHPERLREMRAAARLEYLDKYTAEQNYKALIEVYEMAMENARRRKQESVAALVAASRAE